MKATSKLTSLTMLAIVMGSMWFVTDMESSADRVFIERAPISATR